VGPVEQLEHLLELVRRDPHTLVDHREQHAVGAVRDHLEHDLAVGVLKGVLEEIRERLPQPQGIGPDRGRGGLGHADQDPVAVEEVAHERLQGGDQDDPLRLQHHVARIQAAHRDEIVGQPDQPIGLHGEHVEELRHLRIGQLAATTLEHIDETPDRRQRCAHLVAGHRDQVHVA
jgi:hypothetical protein